MVWEFNLTRQDLYRFRVQAVVGRDYPVAADLTVPTNAQFGLADFSTGLSFVLKEDLDAEDFAVAVSGFDTQDSWHSPAAGRFSFTVAAPSSVLAKTYEASIQLSDAVGNKFTLGDFPLTARLVPELITGNEPSIPPGASSNWFTGSIEGGTDSVVVPITGMSAGGRVLPVLLGTSSGFVTLTATPQSGGVLVRAPSPAPEGGQFNFALLVYAL